MKSMTAGKVEFRLGKVRPVNVLVMLLACILLFGVWFGTQDVMDASAEMLTIDFEQLPNGNPTSQGMVLTTQFVNRYAVQFQDGVEVVACNPALPAGVSCQEAHSGSRAVQPLFEDEFNRKPIDIRFASPAASVSLYVTSDANYDVGRQVTVSMEAYDSAGRLVGRDTETYTHNQTWRRMELGSGTANISRVLLSGGASIQAEDSNALVIDDLQFEIPEPPTPLPPDRQPPVVSIGAPAQDQTFDQNRIDLQFRAQDDRQVDTVSLEVVHNDSGQPVVPFSEANICGSAVYGPCSNPESYSHDIALDPNLEGLYTITVEACDSSGLCTTEKRNFSMGGLPIDLWTLGIEYNQAIQDYIFTDLDRPPGTSGLITSDESSFGMPIIPGKPMAVRVYVGLREDPGSPSAPAEGFQATGELEVLIGGESVQVLSPINNAGCSEQSGATGGQACLSVISVYPSLGRTVQRRDPVTLITGDVELPTKSDYDLDLIDERVSLEGTLNFVIPAALLGDASESSLTLRATVQPIGRAERSPGDNTFELQLDQFTDPNPLSLGLVRVATLAVDAPSFLESQTMLSEMLELMPYDALNLVRNWRYVYDGGRMRIRLRLFDLFELAEEQLTQCETLWLDLFAAYGLTNDYTLFAVSPASVNLQGCGGLGWHVPSYGGIALAENAFTTDDHDSIGTMAQEAYHAVLDRRHVSNDHEESEGCFLQEGVLADLVEVVGFDPDCWKPAAYAHGAIGEYPHVGEYIYGDRGSVGIEIEPDGGSWILTLYDPCPTGRLDRTDNLAALDWIGRRWDDFAYLADSLNIYLCREHANDSPQNAPHDFMSYGDNPWTSVQQFLGETKIPEELSGRRPQHYLLQTIPPTGSSQNNLTVESEPGLQVTAVLTNSGAGFVPAMPVPAGTLPVQGESQSPLTLQVEAADQSYEYPMAFAFTPAHTRSLVFTTASLPPGLEPDRLAILFQGKEIASSEASQNAPTVRVISPNGGESWLAGEIETITWEASDADGDLLRMRVEFSSDAGKSWITLGIVGGDTNSLSISADDLASSPLAIIRVVASDGLRLGSDGSDATFCVRSTDGCAPLTIEHEGGASSAPIGLLLLLAAVFVLGGILILVGIWIRYRSHAR